MALDKGNIILYEDEVGAAVEVHLRDEMVWLSQAQMVDLFGRDQSVISRHINSIFREEELPKESNMQKMHIANSDRPVVFYNLDVIISVGYRVKSQRGTQFRIWATSVLKEHLVQGYTLNQKRLTEQGITEAVQMLDLLQNTLNSHKLLSGEGQAVLEIVTSYAKTWQFLWQYDEDSLPAVKKKAASAMVLDPDKAWDAIASLKKELFAKGEATAIFGQSRDAGLAGIFGATAQTFGGQDLYPTLEEKAAHLLYFIIKDHPFVDGNKRIGTFIFLLFLRLNKLKHSLNPNGMVALTLLVASSDAGQKDLMIRLIVNLLNT